MKRFKNILMLYAQRVGDEAALARATALAMRNGARLTVAEVHPPGVERERGFLEERRAHLERLVVSVRHEGVDARIQVLQGRAFLEVSRAVLREGHDLVVLSADGIEGLPALNFGSTSMHLMRKCPCPVWVMKPAAGRRFHRILAAVDPAPDGPANPLDLQILEMASSLARTERCRLDIINAWELDGADLHTSRSEITPDIRARLLERNEAARRQALGRLVEHVDLRDVCFDLHLPAGRPELAIPALVRDHEGDLIVMGTATRGGVAGLLIGTTAELVLRQVDCSVLTVKPEDFITPVTLES